MCFIRMAKLIMLVGLPASGKSRLAKKLERKGFIVHSSDSLREEMFGDVNCQDKNAKLFNELHNRIKRDLSNGKTVVYDATNIDYKKRMNFIKDLKCHKECFFLATPYEKCLEYNKLRSRSIPEDVIKRMYLNFYIPQYYEGWDNIRIIYNTKGLVIYDNKDYLFNLHILFNGDNGLNYINQDNPHHKFTIGRHCALCHTFTELLSEDFCLRQAALFHDVGKRFTRHYDEVKGYCTYYQHHHISAYETLFYIKKYEIKEILKICAYIQWHMQPFFGITEKHRNILGEDFCNNLLLLHKADKKASNTDKL